MFLTSLEHRDLQPEIMDQPTLDPRRHRAALVGLGRINWWSACTRILWPPLAELARSQQGRPVTILDVATGGGDIPIHLWKRAQRARLPMLIEACDLSSTALEYAREKASNSSANLRFFQLDALAAPLPRSYDAIICSLFLHHLNPDQAIRFLGHLRDAANHLVLINDLVRSRTGFLLAWLGTRILTRCDVVHFDGPRSVSGAFTPSEALSLAEQAGLSGAQVHRRWPSRYLLSWRRPWA